MSSPDSPVSTVKMHPSREKIHARAVSGHHTAWRHACVWLTQIVYFGLPWLQWHDRPAVLFDLATRKFAIFGIVLWPQDLVYLAGLLILCALLLFFLSALAGRVWCSFACPHTVYTEIFMWVEQRIEGSRSARMQLDRLPWSLSKLRKKAIKHALWIAIALWTGITFVAYFTPIRTLLAEIVAMALGPWQIFWMAFYAGLTYLNAGWMREQVCKHMCAYARFQSVMFDPDTLLITYDRERGEPRGPLRKNRHPQAPRQGDCVDCTLCLQVCPVGIDIRDGLQYECLDCAACIDACDAVMDKLGRPRGLIRYSTGNAMACRLSPRKIRQRLLRPRIMMYGGLLALGIALYFSALALRAPLRLNVLPDRGALGQPGADGMLENVYRLHVMNTDEHPRRFRISVSGIENARLADEGWAEVAAASSRLVPVRVGVPRDQCKPGASRIWIELIELGRDGARIREPAMFYMPTGACVESIEAGEEQEVDRS
ncbi:MAG TPA: cytochrome c oxidase accessory protein CcoG [Oxalobacteraceae bacterium]|nr:cytochrome c oxidase accessory protein CcoG [Oxalobacteraceae bacterium]